MPKTRKACARPQPYQKRFQITECDNVSSARAKGNRLMRRASMMWRVDPQYNPQLNQDGPVGNMFIMKYTFPELAKPNATDLSSLCAPNDILIPKIQDIQVLSYGGPMVEQRQNPGLLGWKTNEMVKSVIMCTLRNPNLWYDDWRNEWVTNFAAGLYTLDEPSAALELVMAHAKPFMVRIDAPSSIRQTSQGAAVPGGKCGVMPNTDDGKMFQCKLPQLLQTSEIWFVNLSPGFFDITRRAESSVWVNIDYDYEKVDMKQFFWMKTQDPDSIFNAYNDTPDAKAIGPMVISVDNQGTDSAASSYGWVSEGDLSVSITSTSGTQAPTVEGEIQTVTSEEPTLHHNEAKKFITSAARINSKKLLVAPTESRTAIRRLPTMDI